LGYQAAQATETAKALILKNVQEAAKSAKNLASVHVLAKNVLILKTRIEKTRIEKTKITRRIL